MWRVNLTNKPHPIPTPTNQSSNTIMNKSSKLELHQFYHTTLFSLLKQTILQAIKNSYLSTWPNLTINIIKRHIHSSLVTSKVHMNQSRNNFSSTKQKYQQPNEGQPIELLSQHTNVFFTKIFSYYMIIIETKY